MSGRSQASTHRLGRWEIDLGRRELRAAGARVPIGSKAFDIVEVLLRAPGMLIDKEELTRHVWPHRNVDDNTLQVHISAVRRALGEDRALIQTTSGRGYRLLGDWTTEQEPEPEAADVGGVILARPTLRPLHDTLPTAITELIGRETAIQRITDLLSAHRVVTLVGPGGIGKTRLAVAIANDLRSDFSDGLWFADLSPLSEAGLVPSAIANALRLNLEGGEIEPGRIARAIGDRPCLIVLDNCEHVIDIAAVTVETIVRTCRAASVLATSREPLRIDAEAVYRVLPLSLPSDEPATTTELLQHSAVRLFAARAPALKLGEGTETAGLRTVATICRHLDGIPLAIELAAASSTTLGLEETARHLNDRFHLLVGGRRTAPLRQRTLLAALDWSHELLSETERLILRRLAVFTGGFSLDAACAVAATADESRRGIIDGVAGLVTKSLVAVETIANNTRYHLLETVRAYALDKLAESGEAEAAAGRHARFYTELLNQAQADWVKQPLEAWRRSYRQEMDNVRTALDWAFSPQGDQELAVVLTSNAISLMFDLSLVAECHRYADKALQLIRVGVPSDRSCELHLLTARQATRVYTDGPSPEAMATWESILELAEARDDVDCQLRALWGLWNDSTYAGTPVAALAFARRFMELAVSRGDQPIVLMGHRIVGISLHYIGDQPAARVHLQQVIERYVRSVDNMHFIGSRLDHATVSRATLARVLWLQGEPDEALRVSNIAVENAFADDHLTSVLYILVESSVPLALALGDHAATERFVEILLERAARSGFRIWQIYGHCYQQVLRVRAGDRRVDLRRLSESIRELRDIGFCAQLTLFLSVLAAGQAIAGNVAEGLRTINEALDWSEAHEQRWYDAELLRTKAGIVRRQSSAAGYAEAEALLREALVVAARQGSLSLELRAAASLARLLIEEGRPDQARSVLAPIYGRFSEGFGSADLITARALLAEL